MVSHGGFSGDDRDNMILIDSSLTRMLLQCCHVDCTAGDGDTPESCSSRRELLKARDVHGWAWPIPRSQIDL